MKKLLESYIQDDFNKNNKVASPKFTSSPQISIEFAKSTINLPVKNPIIDSDYVAKKNNNQLDKTSDSWALVNDDLDESINLLLPTAITSKLLEKPEFLSNKRIGAPKL